MARYLMNSAVISHDCPGMYSYRLASVEELIAFVQAGDVVSTVAYPESLAWVAELSGVTFPPSRDTYPLPPGDEAFMIRRTTRLVNTWKPRTPFDPAQVELGLLRCEVPPGSGARGVTHPRQAGHRVTTSPVVHWVLPIRR
jgi:hypothetical protein